MIGPDCMIGGTERGSPALHPRVPGSGELARQAPQLDEALGEGLVEGVTRVVRREVEVVEAALTPAPRGDGPPAVQGHADVAGHVLLALGDEDVESVLEGGEPQPVVDELAPALLDAALEAGELP